VHAAASRAAVATPLLSVMDTALLTASLASLPAAAVASNAVAQSSLSMMNTALLMSSLASRPAAAVPRTLFLDAQEASCTEQAASNP